MVLHHPFDDLPTAFNPPSGFIATANNRAVDDSYPYLLTTMPDSPLRIVELIEAQQEPFTPESMRLIHGDTYNAAGPILIPTLLGLISTRAGQDAGGSRPVHCWKPSSPN
jgi:penicillin amidase